MAQKIKTDLVRFNSDLLDTQLKTALTSAVCLGVVGDITGIYVLMSDDATQPQITQALSIASAHDYTQKTTAQQAEADGKVNIAAWAAKVDQALTDMQTKLTTFKGASTLQNAAPLLIEVSEDMILTLKALKYIASRIPQ